MEEIRGELLVVDDDMVLLQNCRAWFEQGPYQIHTAVSGEQALEIISEKMIDVLIADYILPGINGIELIERVVKIRPDLQTIVFTGYGDMASAKKAIELGVKAYIEKEGTLKAKGGGEVVFLAKDMQTDLAALQARVDRLLNTNFRYQIVSVMNSALRLWETTMRKRSKNVSNYVYKATFAEASGIWAVQEESGVLRTRGLDRYLEISKLPARPRKDMVLRSVWFVLDNSKETDAELWQDLKKRAERLERLSGQG